MNIIGRKKEIEVLENTLESKEAEMIAVYGRRRIGKTFLISQFYRDKTTLFTLVGVAGASAKSQLQSFSLALAQAFDLKQVPKLPRTWHDAFSLLQSSIRDYQGNKKITLFFDELPWLSGQTPHMLRWLEHFWNSFACHQSNVILVLCGSAASWMIKKIVRNTKGLYGRLTQKIHLQPFTIEETAKYLIAKGVQLSPRHLIELYLTVGGVAKYLNHIPKGRSPAEVIQDLCFSHHGFLRDEFNELFASLFDNSERHIDVIRTLAKAQYGMSKKEIALNSSVSSGGRLAETLDELGASGFVTTLPFFHSRKKNTTYRVIDEYTLFYLRWIEPSFSTQNKALSSTYWPTIQGSPSYFTWAGYAFESFCLKHMPEIIDKLKISVVARSLWQWRHLDKKSEYPNAQIDLIIERSDKTLHLCEIKFLSNRLKISSAYAQKLEARKEVFREITGYQGSIFTTLISFRGSERNPAYLSAVDNEVCIETFFD